MIPRAPSLDSVPRRACVIGLLFALSVPALHAARAHAATDPRADARAALALLGERGPVRVVWRETSALPTHLSGRLAPPAGGDAVGAARLFVERHRPLFGLRDPARELTPQAALQTRAGTFVRFEQTRDGLPVSGAHLVIGIARDGAVFLANSSLSVLPSSGLEPRLDAETARALVRAHGAIAGRARLVLHRVGGELRPCWLVYGRTARPFGIWEYVVDAAEGRIVGRKSRLFTARGRVYTLSPAQGNPLLIEPELPLLQAEDRLQGAYADVFRATINDYYSLVTVERRAVPVGGEFLYDPTDPDFLDPFTEVQAYYHVTRLHDWLSTAFGFRRTTRGDSQTITVYTNLGIQMSGGLARFDNAFYGDLDGDGRGDLCFGQGFVDFAYDADVIYHEFGHSVVDEGPRLDGIGVDALGLNLDPLALNEGFADYISSTFAQDPYLGEYVGQIMGGTIRQLVDDPGETMRCRDVPLMGESHDDSMPFSRGLWDVREILGAVKADEAIFAALQALTPESSFADATRSILAIVEQRFGAADAEAVEQRLLSRDLVTCSRIVPLQSGDSRTGYVFGHWTVGNFRVPHAVQYSVEVPENATRLSFGLDAYGAQGGGVKLIPYVRRGDPVTVRDQGYSLAYDADVTGQANRTLVLSKDDETKKLLPGGTYHLLVTNDGEDDLVFDLKVTLTVAPPQTDAGLPDSGPPLDGASLDGGAGSGEDSGTDAGGHESGRGCALASGAGSPAAPTALLLLVPLALGRLRRRLASGRNAR